MHWKPLLLSTLCLLSTSGIAGLSAAEIVAHRGASFDAPENTRASVELAWQQQADAVEVDVYLSTDQQIFAMHDKTPKRYGGPDRPVIGMSWSELSQLDVGAWKDSRFKGEPVPLLADLLPLTPEGKRVFIEIKHGPEIVPVLKRVLAETKIPRERYCIIAFSEEVTAAVRQQMPEVDMYWLASIKEKNGQLQPTAEEIIATARTLDVPGVDLGGAITEETVKKVLAAGLECYAWTINEPERARELVNWGVIGITTDRPAFIAEHLQPAAVGGK